MTELPSAGSRRQVQASSTATLSAHRGRRQAGCLDQSGRFYANALWTWLFFVRRQGGLAFAEILLLLALILATVVLFWRVNRLAAVLLFPYLLWVSFASAPTLSTWRLNPGLLG